MPDEDLQPLINALAEAACSKCKGTSCAAADEHGIITDWTPCSDCNGSGRNSLTEPLRVKCLNYAYGHHLRHWVKSEESCPGHRPVTPEEAEAVGFKIMVALNEKLISVSYDGTAWWCNGVHSVTPLGAILNATARILHVEVTV